MVDVQIKSDWVKVPNQDLLISAYLSQPMGVGPFPAVIVFQEIFGVNAHIREVTDKIAKMGYVAIAPALYQRTAPDFEVGYTDEDLKVGREYKEQTKASELLSDTQATVEYLKTLPSVKKDGVGCIGFCFGGHVAYLAATLSEIQATASFYGAGIVNWCPGESEPTLTRTGEISGTIYLFFGTEDPLIPNDQPDRIEAELNKQGIRHRVFRYEGATHGFICDQRESYNPEAAADAWTQVDRLFAETLKSG
ncbi:dienelactone hydrolase family protein [Phormidium sp. CCY1219]|uniref:dienelactone hydrolase family protein n=1 Tax=Phormidium sp. CCY1219 TaxID=2886104 RepID=UPI002D1F1AD8|nr:dienelactone hydrolase family protein [Phormidium sp. CCY1219]MEB3829852.1 dienelactone hydrolase family protein [Phormidium sp. CCY1219]